MQIGSSTLNSLKVSKTWFNLQLVAWLQDPQEVVNIGNDVHAKDDDGDLQNNVVELMRMARAHIQVVFYLTGNKLIIFKQFLRIDENQEH